MNRDAVAAAVELLGMLAIVEWWRQNSADYNEEFSRCIGRLVGGD